MHSILSLTRKATAGIGTTVSHHIDRQVVGHVCAPTRVCDDRGWCFRHVEEESCEIRMRTPVTDLPENAEHPDIAAQPQRSEVEVQIRLAFPNLEVIQERRLD